MDFILRPWQISDVKSLTQYANDFSVARNLRNVFPNPYTQEDAKNYIKYCMSLEESELPEEYIRAIEINGEAVGSIGVMMKNDVYSKSGEIGYWLGKPFWGKGIMSEAAKQICKEVYDKYDIVRIFAEPFAYNIGSRRVLEHAGFKLEGILEKSVYKNGEYFDSCMYALIKK